MSLHLKNLTVSSGSFTLRDITLHVPKGECLVLMGKSGAGKTTLMEALCGLRKVDAGEILIDGKRINHLRPGDREIGLVPQDSALFPHMTVREHLEFALRLRGLRVSEDQHVDRITELGDSLGIKEIFKRKPDGLSGGEKKRVAIARALVARPKLLCLDEAFTGLDDETSLKILKHLKQMISKEGITTLNITHRREEAALIGGHVYQLH
ncbi:MAG: ATP-binding cassette domain-containing protein [Akkermansiaceae bacterium]